MTRPIDGAKPLGVPGFFTSALRHDCAVHDCLIPTAPRFQFIADALDRGARVGLTDIDALAEVSGHVLFVEDKRRFRDMPAGQERALRHLSTLPRVTVLVLRYGTPTAAGDGDQFEYRLMQAGQLARWVPTTEAALARWVEHWARRARGRKNAA
jgi:hypothetical protein